MSSLAQDVRSGRIETRFAWSGSSALTDHLSVDDKLLMLRN